MDHTILQGLKQKNILPGIFDLSLFTPLLIKLLGFLEAVAAFVNVYSGNPKAQSHGLTEAIFIPAQTEGDATDAAKSASPVASIKQWARYVCRPDLLRR